MLGHEKQGSACRGPPQNRAPGLLAWYANRVGVLAMVVTTLLAWNACGASERGERVGEGNETPTAAERPSVIEQASPNPVSPAEPDSLREETVVLGHLTTHIRGTGDRAVLLLHGYGAPGDDLVPLGEALARALPGVVTLMPEAPQPFIHGDGGRAWYERSLPDPSGQIDSAREALTALLVAFEAREGIPPTRVVFAGFSMGATMSLELALRGPHRPAAVVALSGNALPRFGRRWTALRGVPLFVSHGRSDSTLPFLHGERIRDRATAAGARVTFVPFDGAHEIPPEVIDALVAFLR